MKTSASNRGFTLIELMVTISILGILLAIAAPGMRSVLVTQQLKTASFDLTADLILARSEALKRNASVSVSRDGSEWALGWTVAVEGGEVISKRGAAGSDLEFLNAASKITFDPNGRVSAPATDVRITIQNTAAAGNSRCVELDLAGRARATPGACS